MLFPLYDLNPHRRIPWLMGTILVANVAVMLWLQGMDTGEAQRVVLHYGFIPERLSRLDAGQPVVVEVVQDPAPWNQNPAPRKVVEQLPPDAAQVYLTLLTMMFLHGGWIHLAANMWMLWVFGNNVEDQLGHFVFVCFYVLGGLIAAIVHWFVDPLSDTPVIGASGAVAAVLGGYAVTFPGAKVRTLVFVGMIFLVDLPALLVLGVWFAMEMFQGLGMLRGLINVPVAFWAHIGGFLAGAILMPIFQLGAEPSESNWKEETEKSFKFDEVVR